MSEHDLTDATHDAEVEAFQCAWSVRMWDTLSEGEKMEWRAKWYAAIERNQHIVAAMEAAAKETP